MIPLRWLHGRLLNHPDVPRRSTWIVVFAVCFTIAQWACGQVST